MEIRTNKNTYNICRNFSGKRVEKSKISGPSTYISAALTSAFLILSPCTNAEADTQTSSSSSNITTIVELSKSALRKERERDYTGAIEDYNKIIKLRPQNEMFYQFRGELQEKNGNYNEAIRNYAIATSKYIHKKDDLTTELNATTEQKQKDSLTDNIEAYENAIKQNMERIRTLRKIKKTGFDYTKNRDFDIEEVHQGQMMNCYFLALLCKYPELIKKSKCLKWNEDGSAEVSLYPVKLDNAKNDFYVNGKRKTYHISNEELNATMFKFIKEDGSTIPFCLNPAQDMTLKALEIGFLKNFNADFVSCNKGGTSSDALEILFGDYIIPGIGRIITGQTSFSREDVKNGIYLDISAQNGKYESGNRKPVEVCGHKFVPHHTYIINEYNETTDTVSLSNPNFDDRTSKKDDIIIPYKELIKNHFRLDFVIPLKK